MHKLRLLYHKLLTHLDYRTSILTRTVIFFSLFFAGFYITSISLLGLFFPILILFILHKLEPDPMTIREIWDAILEDLIFALWRAWNYFLLVIFIIVCFIILVAWFTFREYLFQ